MFISRRDCLRMLSGGFGYLTVSALSSMAAAEQRSAPRPATTRNDSPPRGFCFGVHVWNQAAWTKLRPVLRPQDFVLVSDVRLGQSVARDVQGVNVVYARRETDSVRTMAAHLTSARLPAEIGYVRYDFEPEYQPEFTWVQSQALPHFEQARDICQRFGRKVFPAPMNPFRREAVPSPWDSGEIAARSHDVLNVQLQRTLDRGPDNYKEKAIVVRDQVRARRPDLTLMLQVSCNRSEWLKQSDRQTTRDLTAIGQWVRQQGIGGLLVFARSQHLDMAATVIREVRRAAD